jgi:hypothetical protein
MEYSKENPIFSFNDMPWWSEPGCNYIHDFKQLAIEAAETPEHELPLWADVFKHDLWAIVYFVLKVPHANHPFIVNTCREIQYGPKTNTLDLWAREHFKSTILTVAETIQDLLVNPNETVCILSYARSAAMAFLRVVKNVLETSALLKACYPDILYDEPAKEAFRWSEEAGLYVKRSGFQKEASVEAYGLIDGQPTGRHFSKLVYDDVVTDEVARSPEMMQKVKRAFDMSANLGTDGGRRRVIGTFYHHDDPLVYIQGLKDRATDVPIFLSRIKPATDNGEANGRPVFMSQQRISELCAGDPYIFNCQQLLNPTPTTDMPLSPVFLREVEPHDVPKRLFKFMVVDPAGMQNETKKRGDSWAIWVIGVRPVRDEIGASDIYLIDGKVEPMTEVVAMNSVVELYKRNGRILKLGVEKVGMTTMEIHIANALRNHGVHLSLKAGNLVLLRPGGRAKQTRIERNLSWPLSNGKIHISKAIPAAYRERLKIEMEKFPFWHDDALDSLSYVYDIMADYIFGPEPPAEKDEEEDAYDRYLRKYEEKWGESSGISDRKWMIV